jgi:hypothetical protein
MTTEQIIEKTLESPALKYQCDEIGTFAYPARWKGKVPLKVRMLKTVTSDIPMIFPDSADMITIAKNEYYVNVNSYGAVSAILPNGKQLGLKPDEFEVVEFHPEKT